ncbi:MAG: hypothetical protein AAGC74_05395, partial [Verrucomicrobiota bacterium]
SSRRKALAPTYNPSDPYPKKLAALTYLFEDIPDNFDQPWPGRASAPDNILVELIEEDPEIPRYVYHSPHYEFICDAPLKPHLVKRFATLFEATREYCRQIPIATKKAHIAGTKYRNRILLYESVATYVANGGPPSSAGVYMPGKDIIMVPLTSLGVKKIGSSYSIDYREDNKTLPHELTHQLTDHFYYEQGSMGWFSEGLAEYIAVTPYRSGSFNVKLAVNSIRAYATEYGRKDQGGRALGTEISAPPLSQYMLQDYRSFVANANFNYGLGLLITTYFFHMDGDGDRKAITAFLKTLRDGKKGEEALSALRQNRTFDELAKDITKGWRSKGVRIQFAPEK